MFYADNNQIKSPQSKKKKKNVKGQRTISTMNQVSLRVNFHPDSLLFVFFMSFDPQALVCKI